MKGWVVEITNTVLVSNMGEALTIAEAEGKREAV